MSSVFRKLLLQCTAISLLHNVPRSAMFTLHSCLHSLQWQMLLWGIQSAANNGPDYLTLIAVGVWQIIGSSCLLSHHWFDIIGRGRSVTDSIALTLPVLVKQISTSNLSRDEFHTINLKLPTGVTPVKPDNNSKQTRTRHNLLPSKLACCCCCRAEFKSVFCPRMVLSFLHTKFSDFPQSARLRQHRRKT